MRRSVYSNNKTRSGPLPLRARGIVVGVVDPPDAVADAGAAARGRGGAADLGIASGPAYPGDQHQFRDTPYLQGNTRANEQVSSPRDRMQKSITVTDPRRVELELERDMILRLGELAPLVSTVIGISSPKLPCQ